MLWYEAFFEHAEPKDNLIAKLEKIAVEERTALVKAFVSDVLKGVLGLSQQEYLDERKGFFEMGLDSLMGIELKNRLQAGIGKTATLATTDIFDHSSVERMATHLSRLLKVDVLQVQKQDLYVGAIQADEPIAIIGMSCRFPGGANTLGAFWKLLHEGWDAISEVPPSRWNGDIFYDPDPEAPGKMITKLGGFLDVDVSQFDADFFRISPKEAEYLDPQQRLLLEVSLEALESAGMSIKSLDGSLTSVFLGICTRDYMDLLTATGDKGLINPYMATGNMFSTACGRVSFVFGLQGPNFPVDTACSSSLVAIDHACETLRTGEANIGLAGGVNLILAPDISIDFSKAGMLSEDGRCKTFDARADGYVRGEGCGIVVLKRLSDAKRDGDPIFALIRSSGINQDGASSGLTVPNGEAQVALIKHVLDKAKLKGEDIDYIEAHGTGTRLGDPIEVKGIAKTYGDRDVSNPIKLGSVKTNIGHLEGAAGVSGLIKTVLALQHEVIPKQLHFTKLNPHIELNFPAVIVTEAMPWKMGARIRRASVSSFGFSGTNSHIIIEEAPKSEFVPLEENREYILTLSAKTEQALEDLIKTYLGFLENNLCSFGNICYTTNVGREHYRYRLALIASNTREASEKLQKREFVKAEVQHEVPYDFEVNRELQALAKAYVSGAIVNWEQLYGSEKQQKVCLPSYPFQRQRFWAEAAQVSREKRVAYEHPLLGEKHTSPKGDIYFEGELDLSLLAYLKDHYVFTYLIYPGAAHLEMMIGACVNGLGLTDVHLANVSFEAPLEFSKGINPKTMVLMSPQERGYEVGVFGDKLDGSWQVYAKSNLFVDSYPEEFFDFEACKGRCLTEFSSTGFYQRISKFGMNLGPHFQSLKRIFTGDNEAWAELKISTTAQKYVGHPALVDGAIQLLSVRPWQDEGAGLYLPIGCDDVQVYAPLQDHVFVYCQGGQITESSSAGNLTFCDQNGKVLLKLIGMRYRRTTAQAVRQILAHEYSVREFLYETNWEEVSLVKDTSSMPKGHWLVLSSGKLAQAVGESLQAQGNSCTFVSSSELPHTKQEFTQLLETENFCGIVHASSGIEQESVSVLSIKEAQGAGAKSFLYLCQALVKAGKSKKFPLVLVTQNCYTTNLVNSPLSGLYKTVVNEHPELEIKNIDLGTTWKTSAIEQALFSKDSETIIHVSDDRCFVPRFNKMKDAQKSGCIELRPDATYLITGGCGDLGLTVCRWIIEKGAKNIILLGRHPLDEERELRLRKMDFLDSHVIYQSLDISNEAEVRDFFHHLEHSEHPLKGIFHLAGVLADATLMEQDWGHFEKSFASKVYGSFYLHSYSKGLDVFVLFSSVASELGSSGQSNYAAANAFMDVLANYRKLQGLPALSISWGPWAEVGMAKTLGSTLVKKGLIGLKTEEALMGLECAMLADKSHITIANINWKNYVKQFIHPPMMFDAFIEKKEKGEELVALLTNLSEWEQQEQIKAYVVKAVGAVLGATGTQSFDEKKSFFEMGFDSLMVIELKNRLQIGIGKSAMLESTAIFDNPSIERMTLHLVQLLQIERKSIEKKIIMPHDLIQDAVLSSDIVIGQGVPSDPPKNIFLTGVTGRLGAQLLCKLAMHYTESHFYCLVRAKTADEGRKRIQENLQKSKIPYRLFMDRVQPVLGDLSLPSLGIAPDEYEKLASILDVIFHSGAQTNWSYSYDMMKATNVAGTEELIKLAAKDVCKPVHHVSTMAILPFFKDSSYDVITEDGDILHKAPLLLPYYQSKWVSEMQMLYAREKGVKVNIYRPGSLAADLESRVPVTDEFTYRIADGCRQLGFAPDTEYSVSITPLDVAAEVIVAIASKDKKLNGNYHIVNPQKVRIKDLCVSLVAAGYPITFLSVQEWIAKAKQLERKNPLVPILDVFINLMNHEETKKENTNTMRVLAGSSIHFPTSISEIMEAYCTGMINELKKD